MADVVLVEDNVALRRSLTDCLTIFGHRVVEAGDAVELYQLLGEHQFDVAVVDVNLPHHDGFSIARYMAEQTDTAVIITTVREALEDRVAAYRSGADIYMCKPVEPEELSAAIERLAGRKQQPAAPGEDHKNWVYVTADSTLLTPDGQSVRLSRREATFILALARMTGDVLSRADLVTAFGAAEDDISRGRFDVMLSRLRAKVFAATGQNLPVLTAHSAGFRLSVPIQIR